jgi:uncharacterized protein YdiU (UPF0061 family)
MSNIILSNTFTDSLPADTELANLPRQVQNACYSWVKPKGMANPQMIIFSEELAHDLDIPSDFCKSQTFTDIMTGNQLAENSKPYAMCYGGHQFGNWANQLGDGRAINLGEIPTKNGLQNLQLKGAGPTPYSRTADGFAVLRSSIREFLCSEAMYHLGIPTTRALSLTLTGEDVLRDVMYNGNAAYEKGAVVCRVSPAFIRFGNFEILAARKDFDNLKKLLDFTINQYFPHLTKNENLYLSFFKEVCEKTCDMIVHWQRVGFVHGVMNTDNMSILSETIDYGPYGWMDNYDPDWTPNTTDLPGKRYRFGNQPIIAQWNLLKLANAIFPLMTDHEEALSQTIQDFRIQYASKYQVMMKNKLGLYVDQDSDESLIYELEQMLKTAEVDMTIFFRLLSNVNKNTDISLIIDVISPSFYQDDIDDDAEAKIASWFEKYINRLGGEVTTNEERQTKMNSTNPKYVLRNYMAQLAIDEADKGNYGLIHELHQLLKRPYDEQIEHEKWYAKRPDWARRKVGCSMLSCSS